MIPNKTKNDNDNDNEENDDCEICKVMEKGLGENYGDLMEAFAKQNRKNQDLGNKSP